jgi:hypothetical protein
MRRRVGKQRNRTDWQVDLKPVALTAPHSRVSASNGNSAHPPAGAATGATPALANAIDEMRAADVATLKALGEIQAAVDLLHTSITALTSRVEAVETRLAQAPALTPRAPRTPREQSPLPRREASTLPRRTRRTAPPSDTGDPQ